VPGSRRPDREGTGIPAGRLPSFLAERRTFLLLGKARGHALCNDETSVTDTLPEAEQAAPEEVRHNPEARSLVSRLMPAGPDATSRCMSWQPE
jgi:hypothetical protein